jgi:hypothetical protein
MTIKIYGYYALAKLALESYTKFMHKGGASECERLSREGGNGAVICGLNPQITCF